MSKEKEIFNYLNNIGCCKYCSLRYLFVRSSEIYPKADEYIKERKYLEDDIISDEKDNKKHKSNPCIICLGLLQDFCIDSIVEKVEQNETIKSYDSQVFTCFVSFPVCIHIREHSLRLSLEEKFPDFYPDDKAETQLNKVWKWLIKDKLEVKLNKKFENSDTCDFSIRVTLNYELDEQELSVLLLMQPKFFNIRQIQKRKYQGEIYGRKGVLEALAETSYNIFSQHSTVPPEVPAKWLTCGEISCSHNSIYLAGRYCKYSRELSQTPWIIDGVKYMESSVQEIIFGPVESMLNIPSDGLKFSSSGREDVDVRCLGIGRPFVLEYLNPKKTYFTFEEFRKIEEAINKSNMIQIRDLQLVPREELVHIKAGEETKTKEYEALCICEKTITDEMLQKINNSDSIALEQETPIRVLHRRPLAIRKRTVHYMKAERVEDRENLFKLKLTTQAGTYVKEFVHGDFNRTKPNIGSIINAEVDILALDVTSINLDWPKSVQNNEISS